MEYYLYQHKCKSKPIECLSTGMWVENKKEHEKKVVYCTDCKSDIIGEWEYYNYYIEYVERPYPPRARPQKHKEFLAYYYQCCDDEISLEKFKNSVRRTLEESYNFKARVRDVKTNLHLKYRQEGNEEEILKEVRKCFEQFLDEEFRGFDETLSEFYNLPERKELLQIFAEQEKFRKLSVCPICGGHLVLEVPSQDERQELATAKSEEFVSNLIKNNEFSADVFSGNVQESDHESLKKYLKQLLDIETVILEVSMRLKTLHAMQLLSRDEFCSFEKIKSFQMSQEYNALKNEYECIANSEFVPSIVLEEFDFELPSKPIEPKLPEEPTLKKAGLFNKRKVDTENELLVAKYKAELELYKNAKEAYAEEIEQYLNEIEELKAEQKAQFDEAVSKEKEEHIKKIESLKMQLANTSDVSEKINKVLSTSAQKIQLDMIMDEANEAIGFLEKACQLRHKLYSCDIVFEKYRDIVSIATFYEYISSGRCQTLTGATGVYNLYESEIKTNMIISQLTQVIDSLEQIKQSQFIICSTLQSIDSKLSSLNYSMKTALSSIAKMERSLSRIDDNTHSIADNSEVIAYNTEKTAFYAKKNAELTNALGYMIALS